jgi:hypothetical protein
LKLLSVEAGEWLMGAGMLLFVLAHEQFNNMALLTRQKGLSQ